MADISNITLPNEENYDIKDKVARNDITLNRTTLGYQCKNLLNETEYLSSIKAATNGTLSKSGNSITLTATATDCYTSPFFVGDNGYRIPVLSNTTYILSWESDNSNYGIIHVFMNGIIAKQQSANNSVTKYLKFITDIDATFITIRFSVKNPGDSITYSNIMLRYADITDDTYEPYKENIDERLIQNKSDIAVNKTTLGYQCKNLLKNETGNTVMGGLTFTHNSDGSVTINGTSDGQYFYTLMSKDFENILGKKCILTGCPANGSNSTFGIYIRTDIDDYTYDSGAGVTFTTDSIIWINIVVRGGVTFDNVTFYPMIRYADITDDTYEPYKESVDERLTENKSNIAVNKTTLGYRKKNLFNSNAVNWYQPTKTSIAEDGTITSTTTSDSRTWSLTNSEYFLTLSAGKYIVKTITESLDDTISANENIRGYNETGNQVFEVYPNIVGTRTTTFTIDTVTTIGIMFKLFTQTCKIMIYDADITDDAYEPYFDNVDTRITQNKSNIAINKSTIGYQCKNLHDTLSVNWYQPGKTSVAGDGTVTTTITSDSRSFTYANSEHYITLEAGNYIITVNTLEFVAGSSALIRGCNSDNQSLFALSVSSAGLHKATFSLSAKTTIGIMYKLYSQTCTIMIRDADILDDTYEPYQPSVQEQIIGTYFPMTNSKGLANNTDLNTITEIGNYACYTGGSAATMTNCPTKAGGFRLIVTNLIVSTNESSTIRYQWIIPNNLDGILCFRRKFDISTNTFNSWYSFGGTVVS